MPKIKNFMKKAKYDVKYVAGSYLDAFMSIPIGTSKLASKLSKKVFHESNPKFLDWEYMKENSQVYETRERLRKNLDTEPGMLFLQSNVIAGVPFLLIGMPAAEFAQLGIDKYLSDAPEMVQHITNSLTTLSAQMGAGYTFFMVNEIRTNRHKYVNENGKLSPKKIGAGFIKAVKAFLTFDITYIIAKTASQTYCLFNGKDPWKASGIADALAFPLFYTACIPLGLHNGVIETKETKEWEHEREMKKSQLEESLNSETPLE